MTQMSIQEAEAATLAAIKAGRLQEAEGLARALLANGAGTLQHWMFLVTALRRLGRHAEALPILEHLCERVPQNYELHFDLAEMYLLLGDFDRGWREYRFRYHLQHTKPLDRKVQAPRWEGEAIPGKTLLIHDEQGYGDTFQFIRMVAWAKARSQARIVLQVDPKQVSFATRMNVADAIVARGELPPLFDCHCQMMDLPMVMGLKLSDLPGNVPYLSADPARVEKWKARLADLPRPLVALCWAGRPEHFNDANRSLNLDQLAPLASAGVTFVSVQKGPRASQAQTAPAGMTIVDFGDEQANFDDTAAILTACDLLIAVDTSPAHLAGALGRPVWLLLSLTPDWRWLVNRTDSPWYPAHRLFRQRTPGDWAPVIAEVASALKTLPSHTEGVRRALDIRIPASAGQLLDQITILTIKQANITDPQKRANVVRELDGLSRIRDGFPQLAQPAIAALVVELTTVNQALWNVEDELRLLESKQDFGDRFIQAARSVYQMNDKRSALKREIDRLVGCAFTDEKSYPVDR